MSTKLNAKCRKAPTEENYSISSYLGSCTYLKIALKITLQRNWRVNGTLSKLSEE